MTPIEKRESGKRGNTQHKLGASEAETKACPSVTAHVKGP